MHPPIGDKRKLSIAVLVGSVDAHHTVYSAAVRLHQGIRVHLHPACYTHLVAIQARYHIIDMEHNLDNTSVIIEKAIKFMIPAKMSCILRRNVCTIIKGKVIILLINY